MNKQDVKLSKFLALVLRHEPERVGIKLDPAGWVAVEELLRGCAASGLPISREQLEHVVEVNDKKRFAFSEDGQRIRASQGHSIEVDLEYTPCDPPEFLYHGTVERFLASIQAQGLQKGQRHHVHLSPDAGTARAVGARRGAPVILKVKSGEMHRAGHQFFRSANGVWLTEHVPPTFIEME